MRKLRLFLVAAALAAVVVPGAASPAGAWTCAVADPTVEGVVCPAVRTAGQVLCRVKVCFY